MTVKLSVFIANNGFRRDWWCLQILPDLYVEYQNMDQYGKYVVIGLSWIFWGSTLNFEWGGKP